MKIEISPERVTEFNDKGKPGIVTIGKKNIFFNAIACKMLTLSQSCKFLLEFEDGQLYYKDATHGFECRQSGKYKLLGAISLGIQPYLNQFMKKEATTFKFEIGEFKDGRRKLNLI